MVKARLFAVLAVNIYLSGAIFASTYEASAFYTYKNEGPDAAIHAVQGTGEEKQYADMPPSLTSLTGDPAIAAEMLRHIEILASDDFGGRQPGTEGEIKTLKYIKEQWASHGLTGAADDKGGWFHPVPLIRTSKAKIDISLYDHKGGALTQDISNILITNLGDYLPRDKVPLIYVDNLLEYETLDEKWRLSLTGAVVVTPHSKNISGAEDRAKRANIIAMFKPAAIIYLWDSPKTAEPGEGKHDNMWRKWIRFFNRETLALDKAALSAGSPLSSLQEDIDDADNASAETNDQARPEESDAATKDKAPLRFIARQKWLEKSFYTDDSIRAYFAKIRNAETTGKRDTLQPYYLGKMSYRVKQERDKLISYNVVGKIAGTDSDKKAIIITGHWDHFGICGSEEDKDRICNGAIDNASGIAMMSVLSRLLGKEASAGAGQLTPVNSIKDAVQAHTGDNHAIINKVAKIPSASASAEAAAPTSLISVKISRDIYFVATTAEEWGLLGAEAFVANPPLAHEDILVNINVDTVALSASGRQLGVIGLGRTPFDPLLHAAAKCTDRIIAPRELTEPFVFRQDGAAFLKADIPALMITSAFGDKAAMDAYFDGKYHSAADEVTDELELGGASADTLFHHYFISLLMRDDVKAPFDDVPGLCQKDDEG